MYSLSYSARYGWTLWVDTDLAPVLIKRGSFKHCWYARMLIELSKNGVYKPYDM